MTTVFQSVNSRAARPERSPPSSEAMTRAAVGLASPSARPVAAGDPFFVAYGVWGALNARAGFVVEDALGQPVPVGDRVGVRPHELPRA